MHFTLAALCAATFAGLTSAYTQPVGAQTSGNPTSHPGLAEQVAVGQPFTISWTPTTKGTVTILLLNGPSANIQVLYPIVEKTSNSGTYSWTPKTDLKADVTHYGIEIIDDATGAYQYSPQFGIKNAGSVSSASTVSAPPTASTSATQATSTASDTTTAVAVSTATASASIPPRITAPPVVVKTLSTVTAATATTWSNSTVAGPSPTGSPTSSTTAPLPTGAAGRVAMNTAAALIALGALIMFAL